MLTISVDKCLVHSDKLRSNANAQHVYIAASMVLTGNSMGIAVKFGINTTLVVLEMVNLTRLRLVKFIPIFNTTLMVFIPNFTATHAITSTNQTANNIHVR